MRHLILVLGDQLDLDSSALEGFDPDCDAVWMAENQEEATHVWCHQFRLVAFFAAMRHYREALQARGIPVDYHELPVDGRKARTSSFGKLLREAIKKHAPEKLIVVEPGDVRVADALHAVAEKTGVRLEIRPDHHFLCSLSRFEAWRKDRKSLVMETFYRQMRKWHRILIDDDDQPEGGAWNFDKENRASFGADGPDAIPPAPRFQPDRITRAVIEMVQRRFRDHPGSCDAFDLPVTRGDALDLLDDFLTHRLPHFGPFQDAMWDGSDELYHSRLSHALNLHLLNPREVIDGAVASYRAGKAPLNSVEGFVRQILGWREFVRGIYFTEMPDYADHNALGCSDREVPPCFWDGETEMRCIADAMRLVLKFAYAHHIQRLMVLGLFAQLLGVHPRRFHQWHMAMYADAIDWVSLPNALGMSQYGDGGLLATKPYCASGNYINRMGNYCKSCRFRPEQASGDEACPFTTLYWDFLDRHRERFADNRRMIFQLKNLERKSQQDLRAIRARAAELKEQFSP